MAGMGIQPSGNSSLLATGQQYQDYKSKEQDSEAALRQAFADLGAFEESNAWTGAGDKADFARHKALQGAVEIARANVAKSGVNLQTSDNKFKQLQEQNPGLGQNLHLIG